MFQRPSLPDIETDIIIIGAGPAGITAGKLLKQHEVDVWILGSHYESQIAKAGSLQDVKKIEEGTIGLDHIEVLIDQAKEIGVNHKTSLCTGIKFGNPIVVETKYQKFRCKKVIIATGAKQKKLNFPGEDQYYHKGISDCAVCDWGLFRNKDVAVIGNHKYTIRAAQFLKNHVNSIAILWFKKPYSFDEVGIDFYSNVTDVRAFGSDVLEGIKFNSEQGEKELTISGLFVEGRPIPATEFLKDTEIILDDQGYVKIDNNFQTNIPNIYAIGDVTGRSSRYDEAVIMAEKLASELVVS